MMRKAETAAAFRVRGCGSGVLLIVAFSPFGGCLLSARLLSSISWVSAGGGSRNERQPREPRLPFVQAQASAPAQAQKQFVSTVQPSVQSKYRVSPQRSGL